MCIPIYSSNPLKFSVSVANISSFLFSLIPILRDNKDNFKRLHHNTALFQSLSHCAVIQDKKQLIHVHDSYCHDKKTYLNTL